MAARPPTIGLIANPASARDIRRVIANANNLQIADRVNIVLRVLAAAGSCGVDRVLMMPPPSATVEVIEGAGHMVQMEKAGEVNALLRRHILS